MTRIDPKTIDYFAVEVEKVRSKHPNMSFGTATIKGRGIRRSIELVKKNKLD